MKKNLNRYVSLLLIFIFAACAFNSAVFAEAEACDSHYTWKNVSLGGGGYITGLAFGVDGAALNHSQVSRHKKAQFFRGSGYFVCSQYKASASLGVSILSVPCGLFVL